MSSRGSGQKPAYYEPEDDIPSWTRSSRTPASPDDFDAEDDYYAPPPPSRSSYPSGSAPSSRSSLIPPSRRTASQGAYQASQPSTRSSRGRAAYPPAPAYDDEYWEEDQGYVQPAPARQGRSAPALTLPPGLAASIVLPSKFVLGVAGVTAISLILMLIAVATRMGDQPDWVVLRLNAAGDPALWGEKGTLWRLPFAVFMLTVMSFSAAALLARRDALAARALVIAPLFIHLIAWIAVIGRLW